MPSTLRGLAVLAGLFLFAAGAADSQDSVLVVHRFAVPDTSAMVDARLPRVSEYLPSGDYDRWWHEIAACEGLWLPPAYAAVRYFQINAVHFYDRDRPSPWAVGASYLHEGAIFMALKHRAEELAFKHEALHFLLFWSDIPPGDDGHPKPYFARCGMTLIYFPPTA